mgnify:CR=1 FL=1
MAKPLLSACPSGQALFSYHQISDKIFLNSENRLLSIVSMNDTFLKHPKATKKHRPPVEIQEICAFE